MASPSSTVSAPAWLTFCQSTRSAPACACASAHCAVTPDGSHLVVANYGSGTVVFQPLEPLGLFFGPAAVHTLPRPDAFAPGRNPTRQKEAHPHQILPLGRDVWVVDLGNDCLWRYRTIRERADSWAVSKVELERAVEGAHGGDGWRHAVFGPSGASSSYPHAAPSRPVATRSSS